MRADVPCVGEGGGDSIFFFFQTSLAEFESNWGRAWRGVCRGVSVACVALWWWEGLVVSKILSSASRLASVKITISVHLLTKTTRAVPSASCRVHHVELSWKNATPAGNSLGNYNASSKPGARRSLAPPI